MNQESSENVGLVRFELTIDGSLRHASVLQRVIINHRECIPVFSSEDIREINSADPLFIICSTGTQRPLEPVAIPG
jgi:hypothetical protein